MKNLTFLSRQTFWTKHSDLNPKLVKAQYAVRGQVPSTAELIKEEMRKGIGNYPFDEIIELNIGNPQIFGQKPLKFNRQVVSTLIAPELSKHVHQDVRRRAEFYQSQMGCNIGAYSQSPGFSFIREAVSDFIQKRDQTATKPPIENIILTDGASQGIHIIMEAFLKDPSDGVMIPMPQYPIYSAVSSCCGAQQVKYYMDEDSGWTISTEQLEKSYQEAVSKGVKPKIIVAINPGNPTGQIFDRKSIENFIKFASKHELTLFADEVYQENVYVDNKKFISFRKVMEEMPAPYNQVELFSFHSISKGITGECGFRGGYMQIANLNKEVFQEIHKAKTIFLCSNTVGQVLLGLMVTPPSKQEGCADETIEAHQEEKRVLFDSLKKRAEMTSDILNSIKGITSQRVDGAMYAFPKLQLSQKFIKEAKENGFENPDVYYCLKALNETGMVFVPGSGFGQVPGTHHFRTTILIQPEDKLYNKLTGFKKWHENFMKAY